MVGLALDFVVSDYIDVPLGFTVNIWFGIGFPVLISISSILYVIGTIIILYGYRQQPSRNDIPLRRRLHG